MREEALCWKILSMGVMQTHSCASRGCELSSSTLSPAWAGCVPHLPQVDALSNTSQDVEPVGRSCEAGHWSGANDLLLELILETQRQQQPFSMSGNLGRKREVQLKLEHRRRGSGEVQSLGLHKSHLIAGRFALCLVKR